MATGTKTRREVLAMLGALGIAAPESGSAAAQAAPGGNANAGANANAGGKVVFENEKVRVISHLGRPRLGVCGTGLHSHPPHLTIALTDVKAKVTLPGKDPFVAENKSGDAFWDPGGPHVVENMGSRDSRVYLIELKA